MSGISQEQQAIIDSLEIGQKYKCSDGRLFHVRGFVGDQIILMYWRKKRQYWEYVARSKFYFSYGILTGYYIKK